jgi:uncharacterized membrane protein
LNICNQANCSERVADALPGVGVNTTVVVPNTVLEALFTQELIHIHSKDKMALSCFLHLLVIPDQGWARTAGKG